MKSELHMINFPKQNTHQIFLEDEDQFENFDAAEHFNTVPELLDNYSNRLTKQQLENIDVKAYSFGAYMFMNIHFIILLILWCT